MLQEFSLPKRQATDHYAGPCEGMGLRVGTAARGARSGVGAKHLPSLVCFSVSDVGCRDIESLLSPTELLDSQRCLENTFRGAEGFGSGAEKSEH